MNDGIGCEGFVWRYLKDALAERGRVVHWHYRGHGRSGSPVDRHRVSMPNLATDMWAVLDTLNIGNAIVLGHSMGCQVALESYRQHPERVIGLGLLNGSAGRITETFHGTDLLSHVLPPLLERVQQFSGVGRAIWSRMPASIAYSVAKLGGEIDGTRVRREDFVRYWENIALMEPELFFQILKQAGEHSAHDLLANIDVPTIVITGERDTFTPAEVTEAMAATIPGARFVNIKEGTHASPIEQPELVVESLLAFFEERGLFNMPPKQPRARA
ncbi:MAG: alpha/beta hydrolase [Polyangiales bacterium]